MWGKLPLLFFFLLDQFIPLSQGAGAGVDHCFSEHAGFTTPAGGALDNHLCGRCQEKRFKNVFPTLLAALWYNPVVCDVVSCFWLLFCSQYIDLYHYYKKKNQNVDMWCPYCRDDHPPHTNHQVSSWRTCCKNNKHKSGSCFEKQ